MSASDAGQFARRRSTAERVEDSLKRTLLTGAAITVPLVITLLVLALVVDLVVGLMNPVVGILDSLGLAAGVQDVVVEVLALAAVVGLMFVVGAAAERAPDDSHLSEDFDAAMERIPGVGTVYTSVNRMSEVLLESETESFEEVKLVEFPHEESYCVAFLTARDPPAIEAAVDRSEMVTLFVPLAPNPFMGGHLVTVPQSRVHDVDMSVEEGVEMVVSSGVTAAAEDTTAAAGDP